ncbi:MAG: hypothetical protein N2589_06815, partial [bacterium]|nr:hypothetical protein [bacterium]
MEKKIKKKEKTPIFNLKHKNKEKLLFFISIFVYFNTILNPFIFDDVMLIVQNPFIKSFRFFKFYFTKNLLEGVGEKTTFYRPIQTTLYAIIYKIFGLNPVGYHLLNILFHSGCAILVYLLLRKIYGERVSFLVALVWGIHPINTEA